MEKYDHGMIMSKPSINIVKSSVDFENKIIS